MDWGAHAPSRARFGALAETLWKALDRRTHKTRKSSRSRGRDRQHARRVRSPENALRHFSSLKREAHHFDPGANLNALVADDKFYGASRRTCSGRCLSGSASSGARTCALLTRRAFLLLIAHVQRTNDKELLARAADFIQNFSHSRWRADKA